VVLSTPIALASAPVEVLKTAPIEAVAPSGDTVDTAQVVEPPPAPVVAAAASAPVEVASLPATASDLGLIGLSGLMLLGAGFLVSGLLKKSV
jgi:hypothetical protein